MLYLFVTVYSAILVLNSVINGLNINNFEPFWFINNKEVNVKLIKIVEKTGRLFSDTHTIFSILKGKLFDNNTATNEPAGLQAHAKGTDQKDERITTTAISRIAER
jgi:hypothetical protein